MSQQRCDRDGDDRPLIGEQTTHGEHRSDAGADDSDLEAHAAERQLTSEQTPAPNLRHLVSCAWVDRPDGFHDRAW